MNILKITLYKRVLKGVLRKFEGVEEFIHSRIEEICSPERLSGKEVIYFLCFFSFLAVK